MPPALACNITNWFQPGIGRAVGHAQAHAACAQGAGGLGRHSGQVVDQQQGLRARRFHQLGPFQ